MKEIIITNNGLSPEAFAAAFSRVQNYTNHCYRSEDGNRILVHCVPARTYSVDAGRMVDGIQAAKLALRYYLKDYIDRLEIICKES